MCKLPLDVIIHVLSFFFIWLYTLVSSITGIIVFLYGNFITVYLLLPYIVSIVLSNLTIIYNIYNKKIENLNVR